VQNCALNFQSIVDFALEEYHNHSHEATHHFMYLRKAFNMSPFIIPLLPMLPFQFEGNCELPLISLQSYQDLCLLDFLEQIMD